MEGEEMLEKEVAYIQLSKEYRGFVSDGLLSLISSRSASTMTHYLTIEWCLQMHQDDGPPLDPIVMDRRQVLCGSEAPHELSGRALDEAMEEVGDVVKELTSNAFHIVESGPYWYNVKLERDWTPEEAGKGWRMYEDVDKDQGAAPVAAVAGQGSGGKKTRGWGSKFMRLLGVALLLYLILLVLIHLF
jgi:hypothetical protein